MRILLIVLALVLISQPSQQPTNKGRKPAVIKGE
jgi:hypothetical protein